MKRRPEMAEVIICLPSLIFSGLPAAKRMVKAPQIESKKAMPPPAIMPYFKTHLTKVVGSVGIQPRPVEIDEPAH